MSTVVVIGGAQGRLCGELAAVLAHYVTRHSGTGTPGRKGAPVAKTLGGDFERAEATLTALGVIETMDEHGKHSRATPPRVLALDADDMPDALARTIGDGDPRLPRAIEAFLGVACCYGGLSAERATFTPPKEYRPAMRALSRLGYAERLHEQFRWTDLIGGAMRSAILWNKDLQSYSTILWDEETAEAERAWRTMPDTVLRTYFSTRPVNFIGFAKTLALSWRSGQWHPFKADAPVAQRVSFSLADRIIKYADERR